jgi:O-antigen/teichoic acid export membrane protein
MARRSITLINALSGLVGLGIPMVLSLWSTPIFINLLGKDQFAMSTLFTLLTGYLMVADLYLPFPLIQQVSFLLGKNKMDRFKDLLGGSFVFFFLIGTLGCCLLFFSSDFLAEEVFSIPENLKEMAVWTFQLSGVHVFGTFLGNWAKGFIQGRNKYLLSNTLHVIQFSAGILGGVYLVYKGGDITDFLLVKTIAVLIYSVGISIYVFINNPGPIFRFSNIFSIREVFQIRISQGLIFRLYELFFSRPELFIGIYLGTKDLAEFGVCFLIFLTVLMVFTKVNEVLLPVISHFFAREKMKFIQVGIFRAQKGTTILAFLIFFPLILFGKEFLKVWLGSQVTPEMEILFQFLIISAAIQAIFSKLGSFLLIGIEEYSILTKFYLLKGLTIFSLAFFLTNEFGLIGSGASILLSSIIDLGFFYFGLVKKFKLPLKKLLGYSILSPLIVGLILGVLGQLYSFGAIITNWFSLGVVGLFSSLIFLAILFFSGQIDRYFLVKFKRTFEW